METKFIKINTNSPLAPQLEDAAKIISRGGLVVFPTETVYGLGASALDADAAKKIYTAKGRPSDNPLIVHIHKPEDAEKYALVPPTYYALAEKFLPGPLTIIMPKRDIVPKNVTGGLDTVAIRCPKNEVARELIRLSRVPIAAPSANISGKPSPTSAQHVIHDLYGKVDMIIDGGECDIGLESTIVKLDVGGATLLRPGAVTPQMLSEILPDLKIDRGITEKNETDKAPLAPGMKYKHYAPRAEVTLLVGDNAECAEYINSHVKNGDKIGVLCFDEVADMINGGNVVRFGKRSDGKAHAKALFSALRNFDGTDVEKILATAVEPVGIDLATYNRMLKASGYTLVYLNK